MQAEARFAHPSERGGLLDSKHCLYSSKSQVTSLHLVIASIEIPSENQASPSVTFSSPTSDASPIRQRPGMYIGSIDAAGVEHLIHELVANAIDLFLQATATEVVVHLGKDGTITVADDGPGLPYDSTQSGEKSRAEEWLTQWHDTPTADGHAPHVHLNPTGVGLLAVTSLSSETKVITHWNGRRWEQDFARGLAVSPPSSQLSAGRGTEITFRPDTAIFGSTTPRREVLRRKLFETAHLIPGIRIGLDQERFHAPGGLADFIAFLPARTTSHSTLNDRSFHFRAEAGGILIEAAAKGTAKTCEWVTWCNGSPTPKHGSHRDGFRDALRRERWIPATAMLHIVMKNPRFAAPTRDKLVADHVRGIVRDLIRSAFSKEFPR